eukprot:TRINITY_DN23857_c1_g1_i2.p1 TRINITY_DN23857_c1_g1~~TRINITY_DN23857_c1_g1_i2.p1  ORF type:complete len:375 (-),score=85.81 TRINITY_DN23857_c1_g1_i2:91-1215(-)
MQQDYQGTIKSFNPTKGYGFITCPSTQALYGKDIFVLRTALPNGQANAGETVKFQVTVGQNGRPEATNVRSVGGFPRPSQAPMPFSNASVPMQGQMQVGQIKSFNATKGWGFIASPQITQMFGKDLFFMKSSVPQGLAAQTGMQVSFAVQNGSNGPEAVNLQMVGGGMMMQQPQMIPAGASQAMANPDQFYFGAIKSYNAEKKWGHVSSEACNKIFGKEVFLLGTELGDNPGEPGMLVGFKVRMAPKGPQAHSIFVLPPGSYEFNGEAGHRFSGSVKAWSVEKGWGFATSPEITQMFQGKDIFIRKHALDPNGPQPEVGDGVEFSIEVNDNGRLQAKDIIVSPGAGAVYEAASTNGSYAPVRSGFAGNQRTSPF